MEQKRTAKAFIHCHSDHSLKDSPLKIEKMINTAASMGAKAITLTDHGTATGWIEFLKVCASNKIKGIPGVEAYVKGEYTNRSHLVLLAKNYEGFQEISQALSEANEHLENVAGLMVPVMDKDILEKYFGNGNVIATSACVSGVVSTILLGPKEVLKKIEKAKKQLNKWNNPNSEEYLKLCEEQSKLDKEEKDLTERRNVLEKLSKKAYTNRLKGLDTLKKNIQNEEDELLYQKQKEQLNKEMEESQEASRLLSDIKNELSSVKRKNTILRQKKKKLEETHGKYLEKEHEIKNLYQTIPNESIVYQKAVDEMLWYKSLFGDDFYAEVQFHGMEDEAYVMPLIAKIAKELDIPLVATNDVHIATKEDAEARAFMKALRFEKWEEPTEEDKELYMKSDIELYEAICRILPTEYANEAMENILTICDKCNIQIPDKDHYPKYKDENGNCVEDSGKLLREICYSNIPKKYPNGFNDYERLEYELDTIISLGYADYTLIVADFIKFAKEYGIKNHPAHVANSVGPGRGSGAGSVVNFLSGITNIDPLRYDLRFERYLNKDRVTMPDIDTDFSEEVREAAISYVTEKYGKDTVAFIRTCMTQGVKAAIQNSARIRGYEKFPADSNITKEELKMLRKPMQTLGETIKKDVPDKPGTKFKDCIDVLKKNHSGEDAETILRRAQKVEGTATSLSVHAAGIIIGDGTPLKNYIPLLYNTAKECWAVQCDMVEAEEMHLLKMDFLGLINLDIITECARRVKLNTGITIDFDNLPFESDVFREIYAKGNTSNVFQFESGGMKQMLKEFKPESIEDIILLVAAYRPGPMDFIPDIIDVKHGRKKTSYVVPQLEKILAPTYGQPVYQEQLMDIFHMCAGFSLGEADIIRRYMSKKKTEKFLEYKPQFMKGLKEAGATEKEAEITWNSLEDFSKYAFNKSHAAAYAVVSYQTAWLKYHYPVEFMCATLNHTDIKKIPAVLYECKQMGITVLPPDVNKSLQRFEDVNGVILYGLGMIKGIKSDAQLIIEERQKNGKFTSLKDFMLRMSCIGKNTEKLISCGAFDSMKEGSRKACIRTHNQLSTIVKAMKDKEKQIVQLEKEYESAKKEEKPSVLKRLENAKSALENRKAQYNSVEIMEYILDDNTQKLTDEYELLGAYISGHPLDSFKNLFSSGTVTLIQDFFPGRRTFAGIITDIHMTSRKSDGKSMAFFTLEDMTGELQVVCFSDKYALYKNLIVKGNVVKIYGNASEKISEDGNAEPERQFVVQNMYSCKAEQIPYLVSTSSKEFFDKAVDEELKKFLTKNGHPVYFHNQETAKITMYPLYLKPSVLEYEFDNITILPLKKH